MSDKFKQFKNELIDLCEKYNYDLCASHDIEIEVRHHSNSFDLEYDPYVDSLGEYIDKNTPKEDI